MQRILPFLSDQSIFEPEATNAMTEAFVKVWQDLKLNGDTGVREAIAVRIIELAQLGERDPERIRERVLREVIIRPDAARPWTEPALRACSAPSDGTRAQAVPHPHPRRGTR
jgi:hypothetical protein